MAQSDTLTFHLGMIIVTSCSSLPPRKSMWKVMLHVETGEWLTRKDIQSEDDRRKPPEMTIFGQRFQILLARRPIFMNTFHIFFYTSCSTNSISCVCMLCWISISWLFKLSITIVVCKSPFGFKVLTLFSNHHGQTNQRLQLVIV